MTLPIHESYLILNIGFPEFVFLSFRGDVSGGDMLPTGSAVRTTVSSPRTTLQNPLSPRLDVPYLISIFDHTTDLDSIYVL